MKSILHAGLLAVSTLIPSSAMSQDWSGPYAALGYSNASGSVDEYSSGTLLDSYDLDGSQGQLLLGYKAQRGNWVFGGELAYGFGKIELSTLPADNYMDGMLDLKGRVGFANGRVLWFGSLGWSRTEMSFAGPVTNEPVSTSGLTYGLGADVMVTERIFAGIELQQRNLDIGQGDLGGFPTTALESDLRSVNVRIGISF